MACSFKQQDGNFFLKQKKIISQQTRKRPYIYDVDIKVEWWVLKFVKCLQTFFVFKQKIYCSFLQMEEVGGHTTGHIIGLNILKLQPIQLLEAVVSS